MGLISFAVTIIVWCLSYAGCRTYHSLKLSRTRSSAQRNSPAFLLDFVATRDMPKVTKRKPQNL